METVETGDGDVPEALPHPHLLLWRGRAAVPTGSTRAGLCARHFFSFLALLGWHWFSGGVHKYIQTYNIFEVLIQNCKIVP